MTVKTMLRAAIMVFSTGTSSAHADGCSPRTLFTAIPGERSSCVAAASRQAAITIPYGAVAHRYVTISRRGNCPFHPAPDSGGR